MRQTIFSIIFFCFFTSLYCGAQTILSTIRGHEFNVSAHAVIGQTMQKNTYNNYFTIDGTYTYRVPADRWFQFGGGVGVGYGKFTNDSQEGIPMRYERHNSFVMQAYARAKFNATVRYRNTPFAVLDIGYAYAPQEKPAANDKNYNALGFYFRPSIGYELYTTSPSRFTFMLGCNFGMRKYYEVFYEGTNEVVKANNKLTPSLTASVGYTF